MGVKIKTNSWILLLMSFISLLVFISSCTQKIDKTNLFQLKWKKYSDKPVIAPSIHGKNCRQIYVGSVLKLDNYFAMWDYFMTSSKQFRIGYLESDDGVHWRKKIKHPVLSAGEKGLWDEYQVSKPCVFIKDGEYEMWYLGELMHRDTLVQGIGLAVSTNGTEWQKKQDNPRFRLDDYHLEWAYFLRYFWVVWEGDHYKMWFSAVGRGKYKNVESIGLATSPDGVNWRIYKRPVLEKDSSSVWEDFYVSNPMVVKSGTRYYMFYGGLGRFGLLFKENIGVASSPDGINWKKYEKNPVVGSTENASAWDREFVTQPRVVKVKDDTYYMWYVGADKKNTRTETGSYQIGLAIGKFK